VGESQFRRGDIHCGTLTLYIKVYFVAYIHTAATGNGKDSTCHIEGETKREEREIAS
jgi:hypothetical protein